MPSRVGGALSGCVATTLAIFAVACSHPETVYPFIDAGEPCSADAMGQNLNCAEFPETTCVVEGTTCPRETYGCADGSFFKASDYSQCPAEGGFLDVRLFGGESGAPSDGSVEQ